MSESANMGEPEGQWRIPLSAALFGLSTLLAGMVLACVFSRLVVRHTPDNVLETQTAFLGRLQRSMAYLPTLIAEPGDTGVVLGCSHAMFGISPEIFDRRLEELRHRPLKTYNLATMSFTPTNMLYFTRILRREHEQAGHKQALALVEFCPTVATSGYERKRSSILKSSYLISLPDLAKLARSYPSEAFELATLKALGGYGPQELNKLLAVMIYGDEGGGFLRRAHDVIGEALKRHYGGDFLTWDPAERGAFRQVFPDTKDAYDRYLAMMSDEKFQKGFTKYYLKNSDIRDMNFSARQVQAFIESVRNMQAIAKDVIVTVPPLRYSLTKPTPEGAKRRAAVIEQIRRETGATLLDFYGPEFDEPSEWLDLGHMNETKGVPRLSTLWAERVAEVLNAQAGAAPSP